MQITLDSKTLEKLKRLRKHQQKLIPEGYGVTSITAQVNMILRDRVDRMMKDFEK